MKIKSLKCPECKANIEFDKGREYCFCRYCGCKIIIDNGRQETIINKNININKKEIYTNRYIDETEIIKAQLSDKKDKRDNVVMMLLLLIPILILLSMALFYYGSSIIAKSQGKISVGSYEDLVGKDYKTVVAHFESAGFDNIECIDLNDYGLFVWDDGKVVEISVAGDNDFESVDYFKPDSKIVISHH